MDLYKTEIEAQVDIETRRKKQQALMLRMVERKVRSRAQQLYETRGQEEGKELEDWFQAESEVLENAAVAPLYRRTHGNENAVAENSAQEFVAQEASSCETIA